MYMEQSVHAVLILSAVRSTSMDEFLKMDVFFVVATLASVVLAVMLAIALWYLIKVLASVQRISEQFEEEAELLKKDVDDARHAIREKSAQVGAVISLAEKGVKKALGVKRSRKLHEG